MYNDEDWRVIITNTVHGIGRGRKSNKFGAGGSVGPKVG